MNRLAIASLAALAIVSCQKSPGHRDDKGEAAASDKPSAENGPAFGDFGIDLSARDTAIQPGDDFYLYANGGWLATVKIPDEYSTYGMFTTIQERSQSRLKAIVEDLSAKAAQGSSEQKVRDFYASYLDTKAINEKALEPLAADLARIDSLASAEDFGRAFFDPALNAKSPVRVYIGIDAKEPARYAVYLSQSGLGLPNRDYYLDEKFADKQAKYKAYIGQTLARAGIPEADSAADRIYALELEIARAHWDPSKRRNRDLTYNLKSIDQLESFAPAAPWRAMLAAAGLQNASAVILREDDAIARTAAIIAATPAETLRDYLKFHLINSNADLLPAAFDDANFAFFETELKGALKQKDRWKRAVAALDDSMGEAIGKLYVEKYFPQSSKDKMTALVGNVRAALRQRISSLDWMSEETRERALEKLDKFTAKIAYPDKWRDYSGLEIVAGDAFGNAQRARKFDWDFRVARLAGPVDRTEWGMTPQTVNAYYNPTLNEIVFPAAILEAPFFDPKADDAVNYGAVGAIIGHEIGHGFDDQGRKSDGEGVLRDWWKAEDGARFEALAEKLGAQYASYEPIEGFNINPTQTMGENIGDLGGLSMAYQAYRLSLGGAEAPVIDGVTGDQRFFLAWAQAWRRAVRDEQLRNQIATDNHSPAKYRVNGVVRNIDAWYAAFGVTPENELWLSPEDRVEIW